MFGQARGFYSGRPGTGLPVVLIADRDRSGGARSGRTGRLMAIHGILALRAPRFRKGSGLLRRIDASEGLACFASGSQGSENGNESETNDATRGSRFHGLTPPKLERRSQGKERRGLALRGLARGDRRPCQVTRARRGLFDIRAGVFRKGSVLDPGGAHMPAAAVSAAGISMA